MGFDLLLAGGTGNTILSEELHGCLVEVRVEQSLDDPTRFAIRFQDDIEDGQLKKTTLPELQIGELVAIAVADGDGYACLCRGPILDRQSEMTLGGPGSTLTVLGPDRRDELDREYREEAWSGRASDVARTLLAPVYPEADVQATEETFDRETNALPQRGTDLDFLNENAAENGFHFWIDYEGVAEQPPNTLSLREVARWKASPPLQDASPIGVPPVLPLAGDAPVLRYNVPQDQCPNLTHLEVTVEGDQPSSVRTATMNTGDGGEDPLTVGDQAAPLGGQGEGLAQRAPARDMRPRPQGDAQTARTINEAALREAGFFVKASASTTRNLLGTVLQPHDVVGIEGVGGVDGATPFRVRSVVHVVNGVAHFMDVELETNAQVPA